MERAQILIVEDEGIVAEDLAQHLQRLGYRVPVVVASGPEAVQQAVATHPDLVVMDIRLRGQMDGVDAAAQIRAQVDIPIVYLTAHADQATLDRAKVTEPFGYILKPFEEREVAVTIEMALYKHKMEKALEQQRADFVAMLTHDIKNPLSVILGYAELLTEEVKARGLSEAEDLLGKLQSSALTVDSLVTNYLDLSTIEAGHLSLATKPLTINDILQRVRQQYEAEAWRRRLSLGVDLQEALPCVNGNPLALERVFTNLVSNALKFTPQGGRVTLSSTWRKGTVVAAVTDTGPGIASEEIPRLFEKYRRAAKDHYRAGTGLGLFIVKELVGAHGGRVEVESIPGSGTCFEVYLPTVPAVDPAGA